jgi:hypothetical protein
MKLIVLVLFFFGASLHAAIILDEVMSLEDQKRTGVAYLTTNQRIALEDWLNKNCNCTNRIAPPEAKKNLYVSINIDGGKKIQLNDNTIWDVNPHDYPISEAWLASIPIKIDPSDDPEYPFLLVNRNTGESIRVKKGVAPRPRPYHARPPEAQPQTPTQGTPATPAKPKTPAATPAPTPAPAPAQQRP